MYGVARSTQDLDLLALDPTCLTAWTWESLKRRGMAVDVRPGAADDPLAGVVHIEDGTAAMVDVIVGRAPWQAGVLDRATPRTIEGATVPVASVPDLVLLKLYAGGPQDLWDIEQLLAAGDRASLVAHVETSLRLLPPESQRLWARIVRPR
ncbi:MAG TPA: hypothetical protein VFL90_18025 [Methylomirabilota bacterium]|nr:hypothetical protein [Methylomirabilota bacterium]